MNRITLNNCNFVGKYRDIREKLDYTFHENYTEERQLFQDTLIDQIISNYTDNNSNNKNKSNNRKDNSDGQRELIYTAGAMGAGKTHTLRFLDKEGWLGLDNFFMIDPDRFREMLPEYQHMKQTDRLNAAAFFHKESCILSEITFRFGCMQGYNIISDGSMSNTEWYIDEIKMIRELYPHYRITIIYVEADWERIVDRVDSRCKITGRCINKNKLRSVWSKVPESVGILKNYVDRYCHVVNNDNPPRIVEEYVIGDGGV